VFEVANTQLMCTRLGFGTQFSAPYAHHMLGKAERPWRTPRDCASSMLHAMSVPDSMWSCAISTVVHLRNRTYIRAVGPFGGVPITLLTGVVRDAYVFRVFGCTLFAKVPDNLRRKLGLKAFRGVMVGYSHNSPGYRIYNPATRCITTSVHVKFRETLPGFGTSHPVDSSIDVCADADDIFVAPSSHPLIDMSMDTKDAATMLEVDRPTRLRGPPSHFEDYVAHVSTVPRVCVRDSCESDLSDHMEGILPLLDFSMMLAHPWHKCSKGLVDDVALVSASVCVEPTSHHAALVSPHSAEWQKAMQLEFDSLTSNHTWDLVPLPDGRLVVSNMWLYKAKTYASRAVSRDKPRFVAKACNNAKGSITPRRSRRSSDLPASASSLVSPQLVISSWAV
jgi:hypothetical protein